MLSGLVGSSSYSEAVAAVNSVSLSASCCSICSAVFSSLLFVLVFIGCFSFLLVGCYFVLIRWGISNWVSLPVVVVVVNSVGFCGLIHCAIVSGVCFDILRLALVSVSSSVGS